MIEYKMIALAKTKDKIEEELNNLSQDRWKLVCSCGRNSRHLIFRRKLAIKVEEEE